MDLPVYSVAQKERERERERERESCVKSNRFRIYFSLHVIVCGKVHKIATIFEGF